MAKSRKLETLTAALNQIRDNPTSEAGLDTLRQVIGSQQNMAVDQAAHIVGSHEIQALTPELSELLWLVDRCDLGS